jgi:hypothetical protein
MAAGGIGRPAGFWPRRLSRFETWAASSCPSCRRTPFLGMERSLGPTPRKGSTRTWRSGNASPCQGENPGPIPGVRSGRCSAHGDQVPARTATRLPAGGRRRRESDETAGLLAPPATYARSRDSPSSRSSPIGTRRHAQTVEVRGSSPRVGTQGKLTGQGPGPVASRIVPHGMAFEWSASRSPRAAVSDAARPCGRVERRRGEHGGCPDGTRSSPGKAVRGLVSRRGSNPRPSALERQAE